MGKTKTFILLLITLCLICLGGCAKKEENSAQIANPWRESSKEEIEKILNTDVILPEDASNLYYQVMNDGEICEIDFDEMDLSFTYRLKASKELEDISGMYYDWDAVDDTEFYGYTTIESRAVTDEETAALLQWFDKEKGITYSLSTTAGDLDGFDILGVAELLIKK